MYTLEERISILKQLYRLTHMEDGVFDISLKTGFMYNPIYYWNKRRRKNVTIPFVTKIQVVSETVFDVGFVKASTAEPYLVVRGVPACEVRRWTKEFWSIAQRLSAPMNDARNDRTTIFEEVDRLKAHFPNYKLEFFESNIRAYAMEEK
jgi:hypothetical protein